jgi:hypothetical protein
MVLVVGNVILIPIVYNFLGKEFVFESIAVFTSITTAVYTILATPTTKTEPILRVTPFLGGGLGMGQIGLRVQIQNIGYSIAKNIEVKCKIVPDLTISLENNGVCNIPLLAPKESRIIPLISSIDLPRLLSQEKAIIEVSYENEEGKKQKPIKIEPLISELERNYRIMFIP